MPAGDAVLPMFFGVRRRLGARITTLGSISDSLRAAAGSAYHWPQPQVSVLFDAAGPAGGETKPQLRLAALARLFAIASSPTHHFPRRRSRHRRHALIRRVGSRACTLCRAALVSANVTQAQLQTGTGGNTAAPAGGVPRTVGRVYVGTAADLRRQVSQYFNGTGRASG